MRAFIRVHALPAVSGAYQGKAASRPSHDALGYPDRYHHQDCEQVTMMEVHEGALDH